MEDIDYYSYKPLITPDRPLCVVALPGGQAGATARLISVFTGLPLCWLDRSVEHRAGVSVDGLVLQRGEPAQHALERDLLPAILRRASPHIIALGERTLLDPTLRDLVRSTTTLVYLQRPRPTLIAELARQRARRPNAWARLLIDRDLTGPELEPVFMRLELPMVRADHVIDAGELHPQPTAQAVLDALGWRLPQVWKAPKPG